MEELSESSPALAFEKEAFELTVEDVYDISYVIGRDLLKISTTGEEVSDLQFKIVRVLEMFETLVNKYNLSLEELKMERDNLKSELDRIVRESSAGQEAVSLIFSNQETNWSKSIPFKCSIKSLTGLRLSGYVQACCNFSLGCYTLLCNIQLWTPFLFYV